MAYYGGWSGSELLTGRKPWGTPYNRCAEIRAKAAGLSIELPDEDSDDFQPGVPYFIFNLNSPSDASNFDLQVFDKTGVSIATLAVPSTQGFAECGEFVWAGQWYLVERSQASFVGTTAAPRTVEFNIVGQVANVNLYDYAVAAGYDSRTILVVANILPGSVIGTVSQGLPSITTDVASKWNADTRFRINVTDSYVVGFGGHGGQGADEPVSPSNSSPGGNGGPGGDAIHCYLDTHLVNQASYIAGGGGGGGGGGVRQVGTFGISARPGGGGSGGRGGNMFPNGDIQLNNAGRPGNGTFVAVGVGFGSFGTYLTAGYNLNAGQFAGGHGGDRGASGQIGMGQAPAPVTDALSSGGSGGPPGFLVNAASGVTVTSSFLQGTSSSPIPLDDQGFGDPTSTTLPANSQIETTSMATTIVSAARGSTI